MACLSQSTVAGHTSYSIYAREELCGPNDFFHEVLEYWYPLGTELPTNEEPARQNHPLDLPNLTCFLVNTFNIDSVILAEDTGGIEWETDSATLGECITALMNGILDSEYCLTQIGRSGPRNLLSIGLSTAPCHRLAQTSTSVCQRKAKSHGSPTHHLWKLIHLAGLGMPRPS